MLAILTGFTTKNFFTITNFKNLVVNVSPRFIIACGVSGCLITKGTDLSAGRAVGLAACLSAMMLQSLDYSARMFSWMPDIPWPVALVIVMIIMGGFGAVNGIVISMLKVPPFIATHGKYMYAIGGNENAAQVAGVNVQGSLIRIYVLAGCMYALAGFLVGAKAGGASTATGMGYELEAIAACTIGGVSTTGGIGTVGGVLVGVLVFELLKIVLQFLGVNPYYNYIVQGLVIVTAVAMDIRKYVAKK